MVILAVKSSPLVTKVLPRSVSPESLRPFRFWSFQIVTVAESWKPIPTIVMVLPLGPSWSLITIRLDITARLAGAAGTKKPFLLVDACTLKPESGLSREASKSPLASTACALSVGLATSSFDSVGFFIPPVCRNTTMTVAPGAMPWIPGWSWESTMSGIFSVTRVSSDGRLVC